MAEAKQQAPQGQAPADRNDTQTLNLSETDLLKGRLQATEQQRDEYLDLVKQTRAEFENYQKRAARDLATERRFAQMPLAGDLLPALDNLERALTAAEQAGEQGALVKGVAMVRSQVLDVLRRHGVSPIEALNQPFDPHLHQAVLQQPRADVPPQTVVQVLAPGYMIHDRVLRPASVAVSVAPGQG